VFYLILETSSAKGLISILENGEELLTQEVPFGVRESGELVPILERMLQKLELKIGDFQNIILGTGPGSFTGLRIGASVAKALSFAKHIPIIGIPSLKTFDPKREGLFGVLLDAKVHGIYLQKGSSENGEVFYDEESKIYSPEQLVEAVIELPHLITSQKLPLMTKIEGIIEEERIVECTPSPLQMFRQAMRLPLKNHLLAQDQMNLRYFDGKT
jgi:tRNA threonylcarbamoyladenosine biosynthesis protein TsaB